MPKAGDEYLPLADGSPGPSFACHQLRAKIINGQLSKAQWQRLLTAARIFKFRSRWPLGTPVVVQLHHPAWLGAAVEIRATARLENSPLLRAGRTWSGGGGCSQVWARMAKDEPKVDSPGDIATVGTLGPDATGIIFDVEIRAGLDVVPEPTVESHDRQFMLFGSADSASNTYWDSARTITKFPVTVPVRQVIQGAWEAEFPATEKLDPASFLQTTVTREPTPGGTYRTGLALWWKPAPADASLQLGLTAELLRDGEVIESKTISGSEWVGSTDGAMCLRDTPIFDSLPNALRDNGGLQSQPAELARYELVIRGNQLAALTNWRATSWWSGSIRLPLKSCLSSEGSFQPPGKERPLR